MIKLPKANLRQLAAQVLVYLAPQLIDLAIKKIAGKKAAADKASG